MEPEKREITNPEQGMMAAVPQSFSQNWHALRCDRFDPVSLWERLGEDHELLCELVEIFAHEGPTMMEQIQAAVESNDADALSKASHRLKGSVLQFSAARASAKAAELEVLGRKNSVTGADKLFQELKTEVGWLIKTLKTMAATSPL